MDVILRSGLAFYWGTSHWSSLQIEQAHMVARQVNAAAPSMEQPEYNMFQRERVERQYSSLYEIFGMGLTTWSPLAQGLLTGKYNENIPKGSRFNNRQLKEALNEKKLAKLKKLKTLAEQIGCSMAQLSLAWCLKNPHVSSVIMGASTNAQLKENIKASEIKNRIDDKIMEQIEGILQTRVV